MRTCYKCYSRLIIVEIVRIVGKDCKEIRHRAEVCIGCGKIVTKDKFFNRKRRR